MSRDTGVYSKKPKFSLSNLYTVVLTLFVCLFCWGANYYFSSGFPFVKESHLSYLWIEISSVFSNITITYVTGFLLLFLAAVLLQRLNFELVIIKEKTLLPFLFFLVLNSTNPDIFPIRPTFFVFFPILIALFELFHSYQKPIETHRSFNITIYLCLGALIWPYLIWFIPLFWIGAYKLRSLSIRGFTASLVGIFTIYWFVLAWCIFQNDFSILINQLDCLTNIQFFFLRESIQIKWLLWGGAIFLIFVVSLRVLLNEYESTLRTRQFISFLLTFSVFSFSLVLVYEHSTTDFLSVFYLPSSLLMAYYFSGKNGLFSFTLYYLILFFLVTLIVSRLWNFL